MATTTPAGVRAHARHGGGSAAPSDGVQMTHRQIMEALSGLLLGIGLLASPARRSDVDPAEGRHVEVEVVAVTAVGGAVDHAEDVLAHQTLDESA